MAEAVAYAPRQPEQSVLYRIVAEQLETVSSRKRAGGGRMRILAAIHPPDNSEKILKCLGLPTRPPPVTPAPPTSAIDDDPWPDHIA